MYVKTEFLMYSWRSDALPTELSGNIVFGSHPAPSGTDLTIFVGATSYQVCLVSCVRFERDEAFECFISLLRLGVIKLFSSTMPDRPKFGCGGKDSNLRFPGYEPGEMTTSLPRNNSL